MGQTKPLGGKTAIVTGASSGIGRAIAEHLGQAGAHVYLAGRTRSAMDESKARIEKDGGRATVVALDVREHATGQGLRDAAIHAASSKRFGDAIEFVDAYVDGVGFVAAGGFAYRGERRADLFGFARREQRGVCREGFLRGYADAFGFDAFFV